MVIMQWPGFAKQFWLDPHKPRNAFFYTKTSFCFRKMDITINGQTIFKKDKIAT
jgi:hypothetical protein